MAVSGRHLLIGIYLFFATITVADQAHSQIEDKASGNKGGSDLSSRYHFNDLTAGTVAAQATPIPLDASQFSGSSASFSGDAFGGNPPPYGYTNNTNDSGWIWNPNDYFTVNFNAPTAVDAFRVWSVYTGGTRGANWEVFGSSDGTNFTPVTTFDYAIYNGGGVNADGSSRTDTAGWYEFDFNTADLTYQYWKIEDVGTTNDHSPRSAQVEFYGTVVPEPSAWAMMLGGAGLLVVGQRLRRSRAA